MKRLALILVLIATPALAREWSVKRESFGCKSENTLSRIARAARSDRAGAEAILDAALRSRECREWRPGQELRLERGGFTVACVAERGTADACYWTTVDALQSR